MLAQELADDVAHTDLVPVALPILQGSAVSVAHDDADDTLGCPKLARLGLEHVVERVAILDGGDVISSIATAAVRAFVGVDGEIEPRDIVVDRKPEDRLSSLDLRAKLGLDALLYEGVELLSVGQT